MFDVDTNVFKARLQGLRKTQQKEHSARSDQ